MKIILEKNDAKLIGLTMLTLLLMFTTYNLVFDNRSAASLIFGSFITIVFIFADSLNEVK